MEGPRAEALAFTVRARQIFAELVDIDTSAATGDLVPAANALAARFRAAAFPGSDIHVFTPVPRKANVVVRLRSDGWTSGSLHRPSGCGKCGASGLVIRSVPLSRRGRVLLRPRHPGHEGRCRDRGREFSAAERRGFRPRRDFILALTADEEIGPDDGVEWLLRNDRELIDADFCINGDGAGAAISRKGRPMYLGVQTAEKGYASFELAAANPGGHSSLPTKDNAIIELADALARLARSDFPATLNEVTRAYFREIARIDPGPDAAAMQAVAGQQPDAAAVAELSRSTL